MSVNLSHTFAHAVAHQAHKERHAGNHSRANGLCLMLMGFFLLPVPFVGIPLMVWGFVNALRAPSNDEAGQATDGKPAE